MSKGQSAIEYLMMYGWMIVVVIIIGAGVFATVQHNQAEGPDEINSTMVESFLESNPGLDRCEAEVDDYEENRAEADCYTSIGERSNTSFEQVQSFHATLENGTIEIRETDY